MPLGKCLNIFCISLKNSECSTGSCVKDFPENMSLSKPLPDFHGFSDFCNCRLHTRPAPSFPLLPRA